MGVSYRLAVLTHGQMKTLPQTLESFDEWVTQPPTEQVLVVDGSALGMDEIVMTDWGSRFNTVRMLIPQQGFCGATSQLWELAREPGVDFIFWLEADFIFKRLIHVERMAEILEEHSHIKQVSLLRNAVNDEEKRAGGLVPAHPDWWERHLAPWAHMTQTAYWTTNPALMSRHFMLKNDWPEGPFCEGKFTHQVRAADFRNRFAVLGLGNEWMDHIGHRDGSGTGY